ncbi:hypothetical protein I553_5243 [Mycobacterium xenopi 4042]|uniref:Uncharacterized protein n=1 Tax=Mycobacterium xenopi 4042 TaxID=1299334 RepID=X7ZW43_MYCXE|nr:hypothetical protein I553_5243 [Mycobacterium xenopi 4042]
MVRAAYALPPDHRRLVSSSGSPPGGPIGSLPVNVPWPRRPSAPR